MTITYPLTPPSSPNFESFSLTPEHLVAANINPMNMKGQFYQYNANRWRATVSYPPLSATQARAVIAFLCSLKGSEGTFYLNDPLMKTPTGTATGTPLVNGASQTGYSLVTDGWTNSVTNILKAGDYIQVGSYLYMNLTDVNSNGSGQATLDIWPSLRASPADNASIVVTNPKGIFRLDNDSNGFTWSTDSEQLYNISFVAIEAV